MIATNGLVVDKRMRPGERHIRLIVAYDGTQLAGYQRQPADKGLTVQGCLEAALSKVCNEPITIYGSSRTDAGVHAQFQVVTFFTVGSIPVDNLTRALIAHLPEAIVVRQAEELPRNWSMRSQIKGKAYSYRIHNHPIQNPLTARYQWHIKKPLDIEAMRLGAAALIGTHDFTSLKGANTTPANPIKTIYALAVERVPDGGGGLPLSGCGERGLGSTAEDAALAWTGDITIRVIGDGFLYHMVRNIAGLLVDIGLGKRQAQDVPAYLAAKNRSLLGKTAPAQGLCLEEVFFDDERLDYVVNCFL